MWTLATMMASDSSPSSRAVSLTATAADTTPASTKRANGKSTSSGLTNPPAPAPPAPPVAKSDADLFYGQLLTQRRIFLNGRVDDRSAHTLVGKMLFLDAADPHTPIVMYINSGGGVVTAGLAMYDVMMHVRPPVYTVCLGHAESMAAVLLCAGEKGHRYALPNSRIMIHQPHHVISGQTSDIIIKAGLGRVTGLCPSRESTEGLWRTVEGCTGLHRMMRGWLGVTFASFVEDASPPWSV